MVHLRGFFCEMLTSSFPSQPLSDTSQQLLDTLRSDTARNLKLTEIKLARTRDDLKMQVENLEEIDRGVIRVREMLARRLTDQEECRGRLNAIQKSIDELEEEIKTSQDALIQSLTANCSPKIMEILLEMVESTSWSPPTSSSVVVEKKEETLVDVHGSKTNENSNHILKPLPGYTTMLIRRLPRGYTQQLLDEELHNKGFGGRFDFVYCPYNLSRGRPGILGYGFVNFDSLETCIGAAKIMSGHLKESLFEWARRQGKASNIESIQNSSLNARNDDGSAVITDKYLPILYDMTESGWEKIPFPPPTKEVTEMKPRDESERKGKVRKVDPKAVCCSDLPADLDILPHQLKVVFAEFCEKKNDEFVTDVILTNGNFCFVRFNNPDSVDRVFSKTFTTDAKTIVRESQEVYINVAGQNMKVKQAYRVDREL